MSDRPKTNADKAIASLSHVETKLKRIFDRGGITDLADDAVVEAMEAVRRAQRLIREQ